MINIIINIINKIKIKKINISIKKIITNIISKKIINIIKTN